MGEETENDKVGIFRWKGALAGGGTMLRNVVTAVLAVACVAFAFTQLGFIGVQFANGGSAYIVTMLAPVALASLLLGAPTGTAMGLFAGAMLYVHSVLMPLDYYEFVYVNPVTSIVMMCLCGLLMDVFFALILRRPRAGWARVVLIVVVCLVVSMVFNAAFMLGTIITMTSNLVAASGVDLSPDELFDVQTQVVVAAFFAGNAIFQVIGDTLLLVVASLLGLFCADWGMRLAAEASLRSVYGAWLSAVVWVSFMVVATAAYGAITAGALGDAQEDMRSEVEYLLGQVERTAEYNGKVTEFAFEAGKEGDEIMELLEDGLLWSLLSGYTEEGDGLVVTFVGKTVMGSDAERFNYAESVQDVFDEDIIAAIERSEQDGTLERVIYAGLSADSDMIDFKLPGNSEGFSLFTRQIGYLSAIEHDDYHVVMIRPASMVFSDRADVMRWVTLSSFVLLLVMFALAWRLLDLLVARRIDVLNAGLERITQGELDTRVVPEGTREFTELAAGINGTVDALQGWIAEAETRMDAELATAKAIQESALPRTFPPYPDILRFDVYATMNAAKEVGGDFYDFFLIGPDTGRLGFVIADVSGKGVPAALFMMKAKTQLRSYMESGMELSEAVENANRQLCDGNDAGMFVTAWAGVLDYATGRIDYVNAGHNPPLLWQDGSWRWVEDKSGLPLGLFDGLPYEAFSVDCKIGDELLLYTDGVTEAMSVDDELYGEGRLEALAMENYTLHPRALVNAVRQGVAEHAAGAEQSDDITVLALEVGVPPEITATLTVPADVDELPRVNDFIHTELDRRLCPVKAQNQLDIAVEELFVNVAHYAYEGVDESVPRVARVSYTYSAEPPSVQVDIADDGVAYNPLAKPDAVTPDDIMDVPIGGLGILMAKNSVDEMRYERVDGSNVVTIVKKW